MKKNEALQILRAIAALLVVYAHSIDVVEAHGSPWQIHFFSLENFGACGVDIFFAISGYILSTVILRAKAQTPHLAGDFMLRRYIRILPIYWIVSLFPLAFSLKHLWLTPGGFLSSYLLLPSLHYPMPEPLLSVGWTLVFEMFFYYVLAFNLLFGKRAAVQRSILFILALVGLGALVGFQRPVLILFANPMNIEFALGCCTALIHFRLGNHSAAGVALILLGGLALASTILSGYGKIDDSALVLNGLSSWSRVLRWGLPSAILTAGFVFRPGTIHSAFGRLWVYLGDASYSIYLTSVFTLFLYDSFYHLVAALPSDLNILIGVCIVAIVGSATYSFVERPLTRHISAKYQRFRLRDEPQLAG